jgi:pre-rRNA-processing protein TSR3
MSLAADIRFEILIDRKENPKKCTIHPLKGRTDFQLRYFAKNAKIPAFQSDCLLHVDGVDLSTIPHRPWKTLGLIDCTWRKVRPTLTRVEKPFPQLVRIPDGFQTAYPRRNKKGEDPSAGLATIEALFIAAAFLGNWDESLLEKYHFGQDFLKINEPLWQKFQLGNYAK